MNKSYVSVWNEALGSWIAASENTAARGKRSASRRVLMAAVAAVIGSIALLQVHEVSAANVPVYDNLSITPASTGPASSSGAGSIAIGQGTKAIGESGGDWSAIAIGAVASANGQAAMAIGEAANTNGNRSMAIGNSSTVTADNSVALGADSKVTATGSVALGVGSVADQANTVSVGSDTSKRRIVNMAAGTVSATSTDAINGSQLHAVAASVAAGLGGGSTVNPDGTILAPSYRVGDTTVSNLGDAIANIDNRTTQNASDIEQNMSDITNVQRQLADGSIGLVQQDSASKMITVAKGLNGTAVDFAGTDGERTLSGVKAGTLSDVSTEAVNGSQLYSTEQNVAANTASIATNTTDITSLDSRVTTVDNRVTDIDGRTTQNASDIEQNTSDIAQNIANITNVQNQLADGTVGLVQQDASTRDITVAKGLDGSTVDFAGTDGERTLSGVKAGALSDVSTEAVNGSQLYSTEQKVTANTASIAANTMDITNLDNRVITVDNRVTDIDGRTTQNASDIERNTANLTSVQNQLVDGTVGLVQQDASTRDITVANDTDGTVMNVAGTAGNRTVTGVAAGAVNATSVDAINGGQLYGTASSLAQALGGGSTVNADGTISAPTYSVGGSTVHSMSDAVSNIDSRTTQNASDIERNTVNLTSVQNQLVDGTVGLVQQDASTRDITVANDTDGTVMNVAGTAGNRTVTGVAAGAVNATSVDAINGGQLYGTASSMAQALGGDSTVNADGTISAPAYSVNGTTVHSVGDAVTNLDDRVTQNTTDITKLQTQVGDVGTQLSGAVQYDRHADGSVNFGSVTLGGSLSAGPVVLTNVANGTSQYDAVNFGQLSELQDRVTDLGGQVTNLGGQMTDLGGQMTDLGGQVSNMQSRDDAAAMPGTGAGSTAAGAGAAATGSNSTAIGTDSQASHANSVALGHGSVTDRDNSVSVGSAGQQRQITNVAAGTADTDAVNVGQMNNSVAQGVQQANSYTDQRINATNQAINDVAKNAYAGIAAAMAMPNMTPSGPGKTIVAAGGATYKGGSAAAVGVTYRSRNNKWLVNGAVSVASTGDAGVRAQIGYEF